MSEARSPEFLDALRALRGALQALNVPWMVIGGVAVIAHGVPRYTADVDATASVPTEPLERLFDVFARHRVVPRIDGALAFARERQVLLLRHEPSGVDLDVSLAWLPFELEAIGRSATVDYAGVTIRIPRPDDLVIYKLVAARPRDLADMGGLATGPPIPPTLGAAPGNPGRSSKYPGQAPGLEDVERLLLLHGPSLDLPHITATLREFAEALEDTGRLDTLERLLKKTGLRA